MAGKENKINTLSSEQIQQLTSALVSRANLASKLGQQYSGDRDVYKALGYPTDIQFSDYWAHYKRQDISKAIIDRPISGTWRGGFDIGKKDSQLYKTFQELKKELKLVHKFSRVDKLASLGRYAILLMGFKDVQNTAGYIKPVKPNSQLLYVKPLSEVTAKVIKWEKDSTSPRYGLPSLYSVNLQFQGGDTQINMKVHHSRVIHIVEDAVDDEIYGIPKLESIYNRLIDLEKLVGSSAEMYWRGARPGYQGKVDPDYNISTATKEEIKENIEEYEHDLRRILINEGIDLQALQQQIEDPKGHVEVQIQMISAVTNIPQRMLMGSEKGEMSSKQDESSWLNKLQERREEYAEPNIIRLFIDRLMELKVLPKEEYQIQWYDLFVKGEKDKAELGKVYAGTLKEYADNPTAQAIISPEKFIKFLMGLPENIADTLVESIGDVTEEEELEKLKVEMEKLKQQRTEEPEK